MSCNCNQADPNCEPCSICTPDGVQCLPDCNPLPKCDEIIDLCCVRHSGKDEDCNNIKKGETLCELLFETILPKAFSDCCKLELSIDLIAA